MTAISHAADPPRESLGLAALTVLTLGALDFGLEQSIIVPALPNLARHYGASLIGVAWLSTAFLLVAIVAVPILGRLGDLFGKRRLLLLALSAFAVGSLVSALAGSIELAIAGRAIQGVGAAVAPLTLGLARDLVSPQLLPRAIGVVIGAGNVGGGIGFLVSGVLVDHFSPAAIFWFLFIFAGVLFVGIAALVRETPVRAQVALDPAGAALLGLGLVSLLLAVSKGSTWGWSSAAVLALFAASPVTLGGFALVERRVRQPMLELGLVLRRPFVNANLVAFAFGYTFFLSVSVLPLIAAAPEQSGYGLGLSTTKIGLLLVPTSIAGLAAAWAGGRVLDRIGPRAVAAAGGLLGVVGYVSLALAHTSSASLATGSAVVGLGWGLILTSLYPVVLRKAGADQSAIAVAVPLILRNTGVSVGVTVAFVLITAPGLDGGFQDETGFIRAFAMGAGGAAVALLASAWLPGRRAVRS